MPRASGPGTYSSVFYVYSVVFCAAQPCVPHALTVLMSPGDPAAHFCRVPLVPLAWGAHSAFSPT